MAKFKVRAVKGAKKRGAVKEKKSVSYKKTLFIVLPPLAAAVICAAFYAFALNSPRFTVRGVVMEGKRPGSSVDYAELDKMIRGKNIFKLDFKDIRRYALDTYAELLEIKLKKSFPDTVIVTTVLRKAVAQISKGRYYPVDKDAVILSGVEDRPLPEVPIISGVRFNPAKKIGAEAGSERLDKALSLLSVLKASGALDGHDLVEIDMSSLRNVIFFLEDGLEIKIGREDYGSRLANLKKILSQEKITLSEIRYIDLRFKEPVIGPRWKR